MGAKKTPKKKGKTFQFELTPSAIAGIGMICICVLLWIFLLGVWTGQTLLVPTSKERVAIETSITHIKKNIARFDEKKNVGH
jgi:hypothetical protein